MGGELAAARGVSVPIDTALTLGLVALVLATSLDAVLTQGAGGIVTVAGLPAGTPDAVYYATVRAWKSTDPGSVQRQWYPQVIDLRTSTSGAIALTVN